MPLIIYSITVNNMALLFLALVPILHVQCKLTYTKMTQKNTYFLLHGAPYKSNISSWQPPRYCSEFIFLQTETGCQLVPKMFSVTFLSGFCPQTNYLGNLHVNIIRE